MKDRYLFKKGFSLVEAMVLLVIISVILATVMSVITKKRNPNNQAAINCITSNAAGLEFDASGNITSLPTSGSCFAAYFGCQQNVDDVCPTLFSYADGAGDQALAALKILRASCDQGGEKACNYFISRCIANVANCSSPDPNYTLRYYTGMLDSVTNTGKDVIVDKLSDYYIWNINALTEEIDNNCCNPDFTAACVAKGLTVCLPPPEAPTGLTRIVAGSDVTFNWTDNSSDETGFRVYQSTDGTSYTLTATVGADITTATLSSLSAGSYYFKVVSYRTNGGNSEPSNIVTVITGPLNTPSGLTNTVNGTDATLNWTDTSTNETGFKIYESSDGGTTYNELATVGANTTTYTATGLSDGNHLFKIVAFNDGNNSADSNTTTATIIIPSQDTRFIGRVTGDYSGSSISTAGDVNNDGYDDILIGAYAASGGGYASGETYLILGRSTTDWNTLVGTGNVYMNQTLNWDNSTIRFIGRVSYDNSGTSVSSAGDVNNDGYDDILIGASGADGGGSGSGETYLILGRNNDAWNTLTGGTGDFNLDNLSWDNSTIRFIGRIASDNFGTSVSSAGDVNSDGYDDILIGLHGADGGGTDSGETYLIMGRTQAEWDTLVGTGNVYLNQTLSWDNSIIRFIGMKTYDYTGRSVSSAGNVNNDSYDDILIGADGADGGGANSGETYLIMGRSDTDWGTLAGTGNVYLNQTLSWANSTVRFVGRIAQDYAGYSVSSAGNANNDSYDDILIGAYGGDGYGTYSGEAYLIMGRSNADWGTLSGTGNVFINQTTWSNSVVRFTGRSTYDYAGFSVRTAGDVNNDSYDDILVGAYYAEGAGSQSGETFLVLGRSNADWGTQISSGSFRLYYYSWANGTVRFIGRAANDRSGYSVSTAGDANNDGYNDILIGANMADGGGNASGETYLILGRNDAGWSDIPGSNYYCNATWP